MSDWGIALLVIVICAVVAVAAAVLFRLFGVYHLAACFASDEEKAVLTKNEQGNGYVVSTVNLEYIGDLQLCGVLAKHIIYLPLFPGVCWLFWV